MHIGVVQVCHNQQWGLVCYNRDIWDINAAIVVCRQVGLSPRGIAKFITNESLCSNNTFKLLWYLVL